MKVKSTIHVSTINWSFLWHDMKDAWKNDLHERKLSYNGLISQTIAIETDEIIIRKTNEPKPELRCFLPNSPELFRVFASRKCVNMKRPFSILSEAQTVFRFLHKKRSLSEQNAIIRPSSFPGSIILLPPTMRDPGIEVATCHHYVFVWRHVQTRSQHVFNEHNATT